MKYLRRACQATVLVSVLCLLSALAGCDAKSVEPPVAEKIPKKLETHGHVRIDDYYWLKERNNPKVIAYLEAENKYTEAETAHTAGLQEKLFQEFMERIKQTDISVPYKRDDYFYYSRTEEGKEYSIYCRKKGTIEGPEQIMLEANELAKEHKFFAVGRRAVSHNQDLLAYSVDTMGRRIYSIHFKNLMTDEPIKDKIEKVTGNMAWANDNRTLFYTRQDPVTLRPYQVYKHVLGTDTSQDQLIYEETDETFTCYVFKTKSKKYIMIVSSHTLSTECRYLDADDADGAFQVFLPRRRDHEYSVDHYKEHFYIRTNDGAKNFKLVKAPVGAAAQENWTELIGHRDDVLLEDIEIFRDYLVVVERKNGLIQIRIKPWSGQAEHYLDFAEPAYAVSPTNNYDYETSLLRYGYTSMKTPYSIYDYDMATKEKKLLKQKEVLAGFDSENYQCERIYAKARDGTRVPISLVYRKGLKKDGTNPLLLYGYGSYGSSVDAGFDPYRISLLDRGFIYAIAHIRGGEEMGRQWYEDGKLLEKKNTFTDFIDCGAHLIKKRYTNSDKLFIRGGSAGGLLIGAVINMKPDLFEGAIAGVPFVDIVTTMLDDSIPLTANEYD